MSSKQPSTTTQTNTVKLSPEQKELFGLAKPWITQAAEADPTIFQGSGIAGFNPTEIAGQSALVNAAGGTIGNLASSGANANSFLLDPSMMLSPDQNPYVTAYGDTIARQMADNLTTQILPSIRSGSRMTGGVYSGGNTRQGIAEGLAIGRNAQATGDALSNLYSKAYASGLEGMRAGVSLNPQTMASQLLGGTVLGAVGGQQRSMEQALLDETINKFYLEQQLPFLKAQEIMSLMQAMPGGAGVSRVQGAQPQSGGLMGGLGGAASGAMMGSMFGPMGMAVGAGLGGLAGLFG